MPQARTAIEKAQFQRMLTRNMALPLSMGVISGAVFVGLIVYLLSVLEWVDHTQQVIGKANELTTLSSDMESGTRGFLLTGDAAFLQPYNVGKPKYAAEMAALSAMVADNPQQVDRLRRIQAVQNQWDQYAQAVVQARREERSVEGVVKAGRGKQLFDEMRAEYKSFIDIEKSLLKERSDTSHRVTSVTVVLYVALILGMNAVIAVLGRRQTQRLSNTYGEALQQQVLSADVMKHQAWLREGQAELAERLIGRQALSLLGRNMLNFIASYLDAEVAALYVREDGDQLVRIAARGFDAQQEEQGQVFGMEDGLVGLAARSGEINHLKQVSAGYFKVRSGLGDTAPAEVVLAPIHNDGVVNGVLELGFLRPVQARDLELLGQVAAAAGAAIEAAHYRRRLQDTLEETHQLNEELQVQQEELRTTNEELEEQSRVLSESQVALEQQQAELEQTNLQLSEQALLLDGRNAALKQAQDDLLARAEELQRASRYKSEFLANMSHELRTPLNSALILAKLLSDNKPGNLSQDQVKYAKTIYSAGNDLLNLINDILDIAKVEAGKLELDPHTFSLPEMLESLRGVFEPLARDRQLGFELKMAPGAPTELFTDNKRLEQILKNLLSNAIKFTAKGQVRLSVSSPSPGEVAFAVSDSGIGIAKEDQANIFEAFHQADGTISRRYGGTGLGLSISRDLAGLLGGRLQVESTPGAGSTFTLSVPTDWRSVAIIPPSANAENAASTAPAAAASRLLAHEPVQVLQPAPVAVTPPNEPAAEARSGPDIASAEASGRLVLAIEDDAAFATVLEDLAREMGYGCRVASSAEEGFRVALQLQPHAIVLDIRLPDDSGLTVLQRLKEHPQTRHIPVHIVSGEDFREIGLHMGAIGVAVKPTNREDLRKVFDKLESMAAGHKPKRVLLVEDDERQSRAIIELIGDEDIEIDAVAHGEQALALLHEKVFDCMIIDLKLPDMEGGDLLERMTREPIRSYPPVIVYTGRHLTRAEEDQLNRYSRSIIIKGARSPERLLDEVTLFLHKVESQMSQERQTMLRTVRNRDKVFEGRKILLVDDDVRNIFALMSALEQKGFHVEVGRDGLEAIEKVNTQSDIDLVLMDVMMPGMDGLEATRRIRADARFHKLPIIAITAKAMRDDQEQCRRAGVNDYLAKPVDLDRLFALLRVWMPRLERF